MNRFLTTVLLGFLMACACASPVLAETPKACLSPMSLTSPCIGVLLPTEAATIGLRCLKVDLPKLKLDLDFQKRRCTLKLDTASRLLEAETTRALRIESLLNTSLEHVEGPKWYQHPIFWVSVGLVIGAGATIGIAYAISPAAK